MNVTTDLLCPQVSFSTDQLFSRSMFLQIKAKADQGQTESGYWQIKVDQGRVWAD